MILADKIIYLRKKAGWSQEELAEKMGVSRQSISKWEGALSVPDMNRILKLSELFDVSTDYLLRDEMEEEEKNPAADEKIADETGEKLVPVSMELANDYLAHCKKVSVPCAFGVFLCDPAGHAGSGEDRRSRGSRTDLVDRRPGSSSGDCRPDPSDRCGGIHLCDHWPL